ncbi:3-oxoacyl-[acyl-carrier-protein] synthase [Coelomomyces lativittatus]|nr:3-oxoacyl-[acyl-carrier-protein] synthase [Coelomomyces lativittatus]
MKKTQRGDALSINIMFLNPRQWAFQYPLVQQLRKEGYPIAGVCVAAGVPSPDVAHEIIENLTAAGIQHISFKPGSTDAIKQVVQIAASHPTVPIILQWTGGRAGGHHSYEDMHTPILETYSSIRKCENLVLVAGSGFGGVSDTLPYLTGDWSLKYHCPSMPFDAVLFGSRMLVSKESKASDAVKELIVNCPGVENELEWEKTYEKPTGGILTVRSELGEPIHKVATRNVLLWKELDDTIFKLPKEKRLIALKEKKSYLIDRLNKDAHKVWFGKKADGTIADLEEMTYLEVLQRFIDLCLIKKLKKWIDLSYSLLINEFLVRVEERFTNTQLEVTSCINSDLLKSDPNELVKQFLIKFPSIETQLLTTEDVLFFISICQNPRYKPVPFIPLFDENFENWYKKDSLWQSEYLEAVPDEDPQRVCILQGPVATRHANKVNVPVKEILDTVYQGQIEAIQKSFYSDPNSVISEREYLTEFTSDQSPRTFLNIDKERNQFFLSDQLPSLKEWLNVLTIDASQWFRAILLSPHFVQGSMFCNNYLKRLFSPRVHMAVSVFKDKCILQLEKSSAPNLVMTYDENNKEISVIVTHHFEDEKKVELNLIFRYHPETAFSMIHEVMEQRNERVKQFYGALWNTYLCKEPKDTFEIKHVVDRQHIARFCKVIQNDAELFVDQKQIKLAAPMDYAIVCFLQRLLWSTLEHLFM